MSIGASLMDTICEESKALSKISSTLTKPCTGYGIADIYKPFESMDSDSEVNHCPAIQQWVVCTP